jgi:hypothetical protein
VGAYVPVAALAAVYLGSTFGPPPADATTVALSVLALWLVVAAGRWIDAHRDADSPA